MLQGLNAHERRLIRKKWRKEDLISLESKAPRRLSTKTTAVASALSDGKIHSRGGQEGGQANG